jgi:hypothetical protein
LSVPSLLETTPFGGSTGGPPPSNALIASTTRRITSALSTLRPGQSGHYLAPWHVGPGIRAARTGAGRLNKFEFPPRGTFLVPTKVAFADGHLFRE